VIEVPDEWDRIILSSRVNPTPFDIVKVEKNIIFKMKLAVEAYFRPSEEEKKRKKTK
jgi:hypothetical protein